MEEDINFLKRKADINFWKMKGNFIFFENGRDLIFYKLKTTYFFDQMEDDLNIILNRRELPKLRKQTMDLKQIQNYLYAILKINTAKLLPGNLTNTTTKNILIQLKKTKTLLL